MKKIKIIQYTLLAFVGISLFASCSSYLDQTPEALVTEKNIFGTYADFQGFIDPNYPEIFDYNKTYLWNNMDMGGETVDYLQPTNTSSANDGLYWNIVGPSNSSLMQNSNAAYGFGIDGKIGIWTGGWRGIRRCNLAIQNFKYLSDATKEEKDLIAGQTYFFRGFFHGEIISVFGGMPFVDTVFTATDELVLPRISYQACTERIVQDYDKAIALLPEDWDQTVLGSQRPQSNVGRITKVTALGYKQKHLLYAASPLMNGFSGKDFTYNVELCKRAADAGAEAIKIADKGVYGLVPWANYSDQFYKVDRLRVWTKETVLSVQNFRLAIYGANNFSSGISQLYTPAYWGGTGACQTVNQTFVDRFEMADGTRYKPEYDNDNTKRWEKRDPRFRQNILVDRDKWGDNAACVVNLYEGSVEKTVAGKAALPYLVKKYWPRRVNKFDNDMAGFCYTTPRMRFAEIYLDYAEAVTAAYGPNGKAPGSNLTAVDAINRVRARAGMPPVTSAATGYASFMDLVRNERMVELCFEGQLWFDIRRWYVAHLPEYKNIVDLKFDKNWTNFSRSLFRTRVFENPMHYWMPLPRDIVFLYKEMYQNPGWN